MLPRGPRQDRGREATQQNEEHNRTSCRDGAGVLPMLLANRERKPTRKEGAEGRKEREGRQAPTRQAPAIRNATRKRGKKRSRAGDKPTSPQKEGTPPYCKEQAATPLITNSRQKISKKSAWGRFEKIFGKIFRGNVSG